MRLRDKLLMRAFGRPEGLLGRIGGLLIVRGKAECGRWLTARLDLAEEATVLEVGCGPGVVLAILAEAIPRGRVHGVDPSPVMLRHARRRNAAAIRAGRVELSGGEAWRGCACAVAFCARAASSRSPCQPGAPARSRARASASPGPARRFRRGSGSTPTPPAATGTAPTPTATIASPCSPSPARIGPAPDWLWPIDSAGLLVTLDAPGAARTVTYCPRLAGTGAVPVSAWLGSVR